MEGEMDALQRAVQDARDASDLKEEAGALHKLGNMLLDARNYQEAVAVFEQQLRVVEGRDVAEAVAASNLGMACFYSQQHQRASEVYERALAITRRNPRAAQLLPPQQLLGNMMSVYTSLGDHTRASELLQQQREYATEGGGALDRGVALKLEANVLAGQGRLDEAAGKLADSIAALEAGLPGGGGDAAAVGSALIKSLQNMGIVLMQLSKYGAASRFMERALALARQLGDADQQSIALGNMGNAARHQGKYSSALELLGQSLQVAQECKNVGQQGKCFGNLALVYNEIGQHERALELDGKAFQVAVELGDKRDECKVMTNMATVYFLLKDYAKCLEYSEGNLDRVRELGDWEGELCCYNNMAISHLNLDNPSEALAMHRKALDIARQVGSEEAESAALNGIGSVLLILNDWAGAAESLRQAIVLDTRRNDPAGEAIARNDLALSLHKMGDSVAAVGVLWEGLARLQQVEAELGSSDELRVSLFELQKTSYSVLLEMLIEMEMPTEALAVAGMGKARALSHIRGSRGTEGLGRGAGGRSGTARQELDDESAGKECLQKLAEKWLESSAIVKHQGGATLVEYAFFDDSKKLAVWVINSDGEMALWKVLEMGTTGAWTTSIEEMVELGRVGMNVRGAEAEEGSVDGEEGEEEDGEGEAERVRDRNAEDEWKEAVIQQYLHLVLDADVGEEGGLTKVLEDSTDSAQLRQECQMALKECKHVRQWLQEVASAASLPDMADAVAALLPHAWSWRALKEWHDDELGKGSDVKGSECTQALLGHVGDHLDEGRVLRSMHDCLLSPIREALPPPGNELLIVPHAALFMVPWPGLIDSDGHYLVERHPLRFAPSLWMVSAAATAGGMLPDRGGGAGGGRAVVVGNPYPTDMPRLKHAEDEAYSVCATLSQQSDDFVGAPRLATGERATKQWVLESLKDARWCHFACHADPDSLFLADRGDGGLLSMEEVQESVILGEGSSVVLSACSTGRGKIRGEGVVGISRSFLAAGASCVVVSLWNVDDESTKDLMKVVYKLLDGGMALPQAMRMAQLRMLRRKPIFSASTKGGCSLTSQSRGEEVEPLYEAEEEDQVEMEMEMEDENGSRMATNAQGQAELTALTHIFNDGRELMFGGAPLLKSAGVKDGRVLPIACKELFGVPCTYAALWRDPSPLRDRVNDTDDIAALAKALVELDKAVDIRTRNRDKFSHRPCPGHNNMLLAVKATANAMSARLDSLVAAAGGESISQACTLLRSCILEKSNALSASRKPPMKEQEREDLRRQVARLNTCVGWLETRQAEILLDQMHLEGKGSRSWSGEAFLPVMSSPKSRSRSGWSGEAFSSVMSSPKSRSRSGPLHWAAFLVIGARTTLRAGVDNPKQLDAPLSADPVKFSLPKRAGCFKVKDRLREMGVQERVVDVFLERGIDVEALVCMSQKDLSGLGLDGEGPQEELLQWAKKQHRWTTWKQMLTASAPAAWLLVGGISLALFLVSHRKRVFSD